MNEPSAPTSSPPPPPPPSDPPPAPPSASGGGSDNNSIMIVLSYLWLLALIPLLVEKDDREVQWHAKHGLVLVVAEFVLWIGLSVVSTVLGMMVQTLGCLVSILFPVIWLGILIVHILCIVKGVKGERFLVPGVSQYADKF